MIQGEKPKKSYIYDQKRSELWRKANVDDVFKKLRRWCKTPEQKELLLDAYEDFVRLLDVRYGSLLRDFVHSNEMIEERDNESFWKGQYDELKNKQSEKENERLVYCLTKVIEQVKSEK